MPERLVVAAHAAAQANARARSLGTPGRKRLEIARALATSARLLLLDEAVAGLTPVKVRAATELVQRIQRSGRRRQRHHLAGRTDHRAARLRRRPTWLGSSPEGWRLFIGQTVEQNLRLGATTLDHRAELPRQLTRFRHVPAYGRTPPAARRDALQSVELALEIAQQAYVLQTGRTVLDGPVAKLAKDPEAQRIYLGL